MIAVQQVSLDNTKVAFSYKSDKELRKTYLIFSAINSPLLTKVGTKLVKTALKLKLPIHGILRKTIFKQFCGGESLEQCEPTIQMLAAYHVKTILDYSAEGEKTEKGFEKVKNELLAAISKASKSENLLYCVFKVSGLGDVRLLQKVQAKEKLSSKEQAAFERVQERVETLCLSAYESGVGILIDGEESWIQDVIDDIAESMMAKYNKKSVTVINTYQMYRKDMLGLLKHAFQKAVAHQYYLGVKLVRGAYMEKERERAQELGYPDPIQPNKEATDDDYNQALRFCINNKQRITLVSGSHNEYSNQYLVLLMQKHGMAPNDTRVYFSQLFGMSDNISFNLAKAGYNVTKYVPYGPIQAVMPYLFRRAEENTSVAGQSSREFRLVKSELQRRKAEN
ncbi:proline dehydrogenase family protein [Porifericola rhodea]|nr:proline dehydrogenase family protein [Porifericola rhodea]WKN33904.1 proline dehydrogenase family protein [Porifericola rhodea]